MVTDPQIDLPSTSQSADDTTLPDINTLNQDINMEQDMLEIANMPPNIENEAVLPVDTPKQKDFANEMDADWGINLDLELEMENLSFLEKQVQAVNKDKTNKDPKPRCRTHGEYLKVVTDNSNNSSNKPAQTPGSPKGQFTTTKHGIRRSYGPSNRQQYRCKICNTLHM